MTCLKSSSLPHTPASSNESPTSSNLSKVPPVYRDLAKVFHKDQALSLPPHRPYDGTIDLLPGAVLPTSRLYSLSLLE